MTEKNFFLALSDYESAAYLKLDSRAWAYLAGGAGRGATVTGNIDEFGRLLFRPRPLANRCEEVQIGLSLFGTTVSLPVLLAPTSPQRLFHSDAELATTKAAGDCGTIMIVSSDSHFPLSRISACGPFWFQLYCYGSDIVTKTAVAVAEDAGALAIVLTVDCDFVARRLEQWRSGFSCPGYVEFGILREIGYFDGPVPPDTRLPRRPLDWRDVELVRGYSELPILVKGILHPEDVQRCLDIGIDGVIVSNHGGRQLDSCIPAIGALKDIVDVVDGRGVVLVDGGVRSGGDVVKALALGANGVCIGRPYLWGLSLDGEAGVRSVIEMLRDEIEDVLRQLGVDQISAVSRDMLVTSPESLLAMR